MEREIRYKGVYFSDGTIFHIGDSVLILYKKRNCVSGFVSEIEYYGGNHMRYAIRCNGILYPKKRVIGIKKVLTEKSIPDFGEIHS